jgi:hypothetical protein
MRIWDGSACSFTANELAHPRRQPAAGAEHPTAGPAEAVHFMTEPQEAELRATAERAWAQLVAGETTAFAAAWPGLRAELLKQRM